MDWQDYVRLEDIARTRKCSVESVCAELSNAGAWTYHAYRESQYWPVPTKDLMAAIYSGKKSVTTLMNISAAATEPALEIHDLVIAKKDLAWVDSLNKKDVPRIETEQKATFFNEFSKVKIDGKDYSLGDKQAKIFKQLHSAFERGEPEVSEEKLVCNSGSKAAVPRLDDLFRKVGSYKFVYDKLVARTSYGNIRLSPEYFS